MQSVNNNMSELNQYIDFLLQFRDYCEENGIRVSGYEEDENKCSDMFKELFKLLENVDKVTDDIMSHICDCFGN